MKSLNHFSKVIPYLYFISAIITWFTIVNKTEGYPAFLILLFAIPFVWQLVKPNTKLNFSLGITFVCISSYIIIAYISNLMDIVHFSKTFKSLLFYGSIFIPTNFIMALWMIRNSLKRSF
ncbi:hypothetical protein KO566_03770 [Flavobacteriaceae bacterium XHP0103]|uniref:hypothetical protein n=1 Tax=Marixanthotalea marina TaxID=2844359 RepID=UPI002989FC92|nr:hypothetical protein [Marixanthotalea marina]MBU3821167.1 hypothetical protein [Marixanthotalea marina]